MAKINFINPSNRYVESYDTVMSPIWCFVFGSFYWLSRGKIAQALLSFLLALSSFGLSWLVYPWFANRINIRSYMRKGWIIDKPHPSVTTKELARVSIKKRARK